MRGQSEFEAASAKIAQEIFSQVRTTIVLNMRFMDMAVFRLKPMPEKVTLATDGENLYYNTIRLLQRYRKEPEAVTRDYLHVLLHCVFRHPFVNTLLDHALWDLACDIAVEGLICELKIPHFTTRSEAARREVADSLRGAVKPLSAEKLYRYFQDNAPEKSWFALFRADDHEIWYHPAGAQAKKSAAAQQPQKTPGEQGGGRQNGKSDPDSAQDSQNQNGGGRDDSSGQSENQSTGGDAPQQDQNQTGSGKPRPNGRQQTQPSPGGYGQGAGSAAQDWQAQGASGPQGSELTEPEADFSARQALENEWRDISEHVQMDLETFAKQRGIEAGGMRQLLGELNREKYDYEAFLKKFAVTGEVMKINDDEFDYIFYTYGLRLFKNMPLIEPLEYKEVKRIREFVIAIDTSGSTSGELVNRFLTKTYNILMSTQSFFSKVNIHIVQCDAAVQEAVKITCREEFEDYIRHMTIRGLGGTDFRPVFAYVDQLLRQHEFQRLRGMIYFTDGYGTFPERKPEYTTAFVFIQDEYNNLNVPPWAIRLILEKEEL